MPNNELENKVIEWVKRFVKKFDAYDLIEIIEKKNLFDLRPEQRIAKWKNHFVVEPRSRQDFGSISG